MNSALTNECIISSNCFQATLKGIGAIFEGN